MCKQVIGWIVVIGCAWAGFWAQAAERVKANNVTNLNVASSWVGSNVPGSYDYGKWDSTVTAPNSVLLGGNMSVQGLMIVNPVGAVTIGGSNTLTTGFFGFNMGAATVDLNVTNQNVILLDYAGQLWTIAAGRTLTFNPVLYSRGVGASLGVMGSGTVASAVLTNDANGIIGPWAWYGTGTSAKYATVSGGVVTGYTGTAAATAANVSDTTGTTNYDVAAVGTLGSSASFNTLRYTGASGTVAGNFAANGLLNAGSGGVTYSGNATVGASKELIFVTPDQTRQLSISGNLADGAGGASGVTVTGGGKVNLSGNNTYSGATVVSAGTLYITKTNSLGSSAGSTVIYVNGSSVTGGLLQVSGSLTLTEPIMFVGTGDGSPWGQALQSTGGTNTLAGPITIAMASGVRLTASGNGTALNINGPITRTGSASTLILGANGGTGIVNINCPINNNGGDVNLHNGGGTIRFNVTSNNIGNVNVQYQHVLQLGISDALNISRSLIVGNSRTQTGTAAQGKFDLAGFDQKVDGFNGDGDPATASPSTRAVTNSAPGLSTFTTGNNNSGGTFNGIFGGNLAYVKMGTGTQVLCGPNFYTGGTTVSGGTLVLSNAVNHGALAVNGGTFRFPPALVVNGTLSGTGGTIDTGDASSVLTVNQPTNTTFAGVLSNAGSLVKSGNGTLTLSGVNTYSGGTTVSSGMLCFSKTSSKPAAGSVTIAAGAGLGLGLGGAGGYTLTDVDSLWAGTMPGVTMDATSLIGIDTLVGDATYASSQSTRGLVKTGTNTLTLAGANTYVGGTFIQAGVLSIPNTGALPGWDSNGWYRVSRDAGLAVGNAVIDTDLGTIMGTTNFAAGACIGFDTALGNRTYTGIISNTVNGALGLYKVSTNTLTLAGSSTYDGTTYVNGGVVVVKNNTALGSTNGYTVVTRTGGTAPLYTDSTGQVQLDGSAGALTLFENFIISGSEQYGYLGAIRNASGNNAINGWIRLDVAGGRIGVAAGTLVLNGPVTRNVMSSNPSLTLNPSAGTLIVSNTVDLGGGTLNCHSGGTVVMCSTNNICAQTQCQYGNFLRLGVDNALPIDKKLVIGNPEPGNGQFNLDGYSQTLGGLMEYGNLASKPNNFITNNHPSRVSTLTISQASGVSDIFSGRIAGAINLVKSGATNSTLTLAGLNNFSGATVVNGGTLAVSNSVLGVCTNVAVQAGTLSLLSSAAVADTATLSLANGGGAKVNLAAGVNEGVRYLYFGDKMKLVGTYGSTSSAATNKDDEHFSGAGILTVLHDNSGLLIKLQ